MNKKAKLYSHSFNVMGCPCEIKLYAKKATDFRRIKRLILAELNRLDQTYTTYTQTSLTAKINELAGTDNAIKLDDEATAILNYSHTCFEQSEGLFDITAGALSKAWDYHKRPHVLPEQSTVEKILQSVGWDKVDWQPPYIKMPVADMSLDFGGVVKEYAADVVASVCHKNGFHHGLVSLGGDIRIIGDHPEGRPWRVGIANPTNPKRDLMIIDLQCGAVASSGNYERCIVVDGKKYSHILNPKTGQPSQGFSSVTVLGDYCLVAGSASTIASLMEPEKAIPWLDELNLPYLCVDQDNKVYKNF